jgi:uncharacterized protein (TIGR02118 family)
MAMNTCLFLTFKSGSDLAAAELAQLTGFLRAAPKLAKALVHTPASTGDPYVKDGPSPSLVLQLYFATVPDLEVAVSRSGHLQALTSRGEFPSLAQAEATQQAMLVRPFAVPDPALRTPAGEPYCTYLVSYEGEAEDLNAWHTHYLENHTRHMAMFPGIRELEVYTRLDWVSALPCARVNFMQRNKVAFDSQASLHAALNSPVRHEMRADFRAFPSFTGPNKHFAMATRVATR